MGINEMMWILCVLGFIATLVAMTGWILKLAASFKMINVDETKPQRAQLDLPRLFPY